MSTANGTPVPIIEARKLEKSYPQPDGSRIQVIAATDLAIYPGEIITLLGASGSGKSTLLRILTGLSPASAGSVYWHGQPVQGESLNVSIVFQSFALFPWLTVLENVEAPLEARGMPPIERHKRALRIVDAVGLDGLETAYPKELSGGMKQRGGAAPAAAPPGGPVRSFCPTRAPAALPVCSIAWRTRVAAAISTSSPMSSAWKLTRVSPAWTPPFSSDSSASRRATPSLLRRGRPSPRQTFKRAKPSSAKSPSPMCPCSARWSKRSKPKPIAPSAMNFSVTSSTNISAKKNPAASWKPPFSGGATPRFSTTTPPPAS